MIIVVAALGCVAIPLALVLAVLGWQKNLPHLKWLFPTMAVGIVLALLLLHSQPPQALPHFPHPNKSSPVPPAEGRPPQQASVR